MPSIKQEEKPTVMVLGVTGMLGHKVFEVLSNSGNYRVIGTATKFGELSNVFPPEFKKNIVENIYADDINSVEKLILEYKPQNVINCIGIIKQNAESKNADKSIVINALFPHQVASICDKIDARLITIATDCVFDGKKGSSYTQTDEPTCHDIYGMTKYLGEVSRGKHLTLRTSIIGHEILTNLSLLDWFLSVKDPTVPGYTKAIFSGFTTLEFAKLLLEKILPDEKLCGLHHISVNPISKFELLTKIAKIYDKKIKIIPSEEVNINRALDSTEFRKSIRYIMPAWDTLIENMYKDFIASPFYIYKRKSYGKN